MTKPTKAQIANGKAQILAELREGRDMIAALPNKGSVLFNYETKLAIAIPDNDADRGYIAGLSFARIFTDAERHHGGNPCPGLDRQYSDGAGRRFHLVKMTIAKAAALKAAEDAINLVEALPA